MSLFNCLQTAVSGVEAQSNQLSTIGTNISNATTTGFKATTVHFDSLVGDEEPIAYQSGGVETSVRYGVESQGSITSTASVTDLAIKGSGFFVVQAPDGTTALTRAGSFVPDANGNLVNTAGYMLMGYSLQGSGSGSLAPVNVSSNPSSVTIGTNGVMSTVDASGTTTAISRIPLATVRSPEDLTNLPGNVYTPNNASGPTTIGAAASGTLGEIDSSSLESSTVDLSSELTNMIATQRSYEANSKVMTSSSDMLSKLLDAAAS